MIFFANKLRGQKLFRHKKSFCQIIRYTIYFIFVPIILSAARIPIHTKI